MEIVCRNNQQINDDRLCSLHTQLKHNLNMVAGGSCVIIGQERKDYLALLSAVEHDIERGDSSHVDGFHNALLRIVYRYARR